MRGGASRASHRSVRQDIRHLTHRHAKTRIFRAKSNLVQLSQWPWQHFTWAQIDEAWSESKEKWRFGTWTVGELIDTQRSNFGRQVRRSGWSVTLAAGGAKKEEKKGKSHREEGKNEQTKHEETVIKPSLRRGAFTASQTQTLFEVLRRFQA